MAQEAIIERLLDSLRFDLNQSEGAKLEGLSKEEWSTLIQLAAEQGVRPLLYQRLKTQGLVEIVPQDITQALKRAYQITTARNLLYLGELHKIAEACQQAGIPMIVLKGMFLASQVYESIGLREMNDIDLLVPRNHLQRITELLETLHYEPLNPYSIDVDVAVAHHLTPFIKPNVGSIEVHWTITNPQQHYHIAVDELWERAIPTQIAGIDVLGLCPEDLLLYLCLHTSYQHQFTFGLRPSCDIAQVIQCYGKELDWLRIQQRAAAWGWERGVYLALRLAKELMGAAVPGEALDKLKPLAFKEEIVNTAKNQIFADKASTMSIPRKLAQLMGRNNLKASLLDFYQSIFISKISLAKTYSISPNSPKIYVYYFVRLKDLLSKHGRTAWKLHQGDTELTPLADRTRDLLEWL